MDKIYFVFAYFAVACQSRRVHTDFVAEPWNSQVIDVAEDTNLERLSDESRDLTQFLLSLVPPTVGQHRLPLNRPSGERPKELSATSSISSSACVSCVWPAPLGAASRTAECKPSACLSRGGTITMTGKKKKSGRKSKKIEKKKKDAEGQETVVAPKQGAELEEDTVATISATAEPVADPTPDVKSSETESTTMSPVKESFVAQKQEVEPLEAESATIPQEELGATPKFDVDLLETDSAIMSETEEPLATSTPDDQPLEAQSTSMSDVGEPVTISEAVEPIADPTPDVKPLETESIQEVEPLEAESARPPQEEMGATPKLDVDLLETDSATISETEQPLETSTPDDQPLETQSTSMSDVEEPVATRKPGCEPLEADCLVVGAGISGSTLAHNLYRRGVNVVLAEARDYVGGNVKSHNEDGFIWEDGPNSFATQPPVVRIAYELGIADQLVFADESLPPWVNHNGKLHPLPKGKGGKGPKGQLELVFGSNGVLKFGLAGELLSWPGKIKAAIGAFIGHASPPEGKDETIREWVTRILGEEVFLRCIDPFVSGVYAGDPQTLSMKSALMKIRRIEQYSYNIEWNKFGAIFYGGLARQVELTKERKADPPDPRWPEFEYGNPGSFRHGLATLPNAISAELGQPVREAVNPDAQVKLQWKLTNLEKEEEATGYQYKATFDTPDGVRTVFAKSVVSTLPAHALSDVLPSVMPEAKSIFLKSRESINRTGIYYPPVYAVTVAYPKYSFKDADLPNGFGKLLDLPGFGLLNPRTEGVRTLGTLWSSSLFPGRCPPDYNLLLNYIGGSRDTGVAELSEDEIVEEVDKSLRQTLLKVDAPKPRVLGVKLWPVGIPQYELGHDKLLQELQEAEEKLPGLWVCGNYRSGVAFPDCVKFGLDQAEVVEKYLEGKA